MVGGGAPGASLAPAMVPMEDALQALIEDFVGPLLPIASSRAPPTIEQQVAVAKQMHSVVLLYNYYHRKQFPQLNFLDFRAFCKEATVAKPCLITYMKFMLKNLEYPNDKDKDLSIMEKEIMDACDISSALDATKSAPNMEGWLVSQVSVFLVDDDKEKCYLEFGSITKGVWSSVEKKFDEPVGTLRSNIKTIQHSSIASPSSEYSDGSLENEQSLQQFALSSVEEKTGISCSNLSILECHMTYSLNQTKTTTKLYIMKSTEVAKGLVAFPIKDVLCRMSGPMLNPAVTSVIGYYHLFPYVNILSDWYSRNLQNLCQYPVESNNVHNMEDRGINESAIAKETVTANAKSISNDGNQFSYIKGSNSSIKNDSGENCNPQANEISLSADPNLLLLTKNETVYHKSTMKENRHSTILTAVNNIVPSNCMNGASPSISEPCKVANKSSSSQLQLPFLGNEDHVSRKVLVPNAFMKRRGSNIHFPPDSPSNECTEKVYELNQAKKQRTTESNDGEGFGKKETSPILQDDVSVQLTSQNHEEFNFVLSSAEKHVFLQASLRILQRKRDDLVQKHRQLDAEIARYEMNIQAILTGQGCMKSNLESMIRACNAICSSEMDDTTALFCSESRSQVREMKVKRLSEAILRPKSSLQELDDICCENGWMMPRYSVVPSTADESFRASITVKGIEFEINVDGDLKNNAHEARLSAASNMLSKIRSLANQQP